MNKSMYQYDKHIMLTIKLFIIIKIPKFENRLHVIGCIQIQGVSENMQFLTTTIKIVFQLGQIIVICQIKAYNHRIMLVIKVPEMDTK